MAFCISSLLMGEVAHNPAVVVVVLKTASSSRVRGFWYMAGMRWFLFLHLVGTWSDLVSEHHLA